MYYHHKHRTFASKLTGITLVLMALIAQMAVAQEPSQVVFGSNGGVGISVNGKGLCKFMPTGADTSWKFSQSVKAKSPEGKTMFSLFSPPSIDGEALFEKTEQGADLTWLFTANKDVKFNTLSIEFLLGVSETAGGTWKADDNEGVFPDKYKDTGLFGGSVKTFTVSRPDGVSFALTFPTPTHIGIEDNRRWGSQTYKFRFGKVFGDLAKGEKYKLSASLSVPGPVSYAVDDVVVISQGSDWVPLKPELDIKPGSALDLSKNGFTKGECGSRGRVIVNQDGHFAFENDPETSQRFYGANLCFSSQFMPKDKVDILLDRWLRLGYNTLRIHHYEYGFTEPHWQTGFGWSKKKMDQFCYLIAGCSKRGIWLTTDLFTSRPVSPSQIGVPATEPYMKNKTMVDSGVYKDLVLIHEPAYQDLIKFTAQLLNYENPYTGRRLAEEPALAWINLINEGPISRGSRYKELPEWKVAWNKWLAEKYPNYDDLKDALGDLGDDEDPAKGSVRIGHWRVFNVFVADAEKKFAERIRNFLREELKCKALLSNHNCPGNTPADQGTRGVLDYVDNHYYVDHPIFEKGHGLPSRCPNINPVREADVRAVVCSQIRLREKPLTVSEVNYSAPGRYRGVGSLLMGSRAALQDWDIMWRFAYAHTDKEIFTPTPMDYFNLSRDPLNLAADRAVVMLFLRGDAKVAENQIAVELSEVDLQGKTNPEFLGEMTTLQWISRIGTTLKKAPAGSVPVSYGEGKDAALAKIKAAGIDIGGADGILRSDTGEITLDRKRGALTIDTPRTAGGYAEKDESIKAEKAGIEIKIGKYGATVFVTSLSNEPISNSPRLLVTHLTDLQNSGAKYGEKSLNTLMKWGNLPYLVRNGSATVRIRLKGPAAYKVWALSVGGRRLEKIKARVDGDSLVFTANVKSAYGAHMLYELTTDKEGADPEAESFKISNTPGADIVAFTEPFPFQFKFSYNDWKDKVVVEDAVAKIHADTSQGGSGYNFFNGLDLSDKGDHAPVLYLTVGGENKANSIKVILVDDENKKCTFVYSIKANDGGGVLRLVPSDGANLDKPSEGKPINLELVKQVQILGDWSDNPVDINVQRLALELVK
ncbi:MAG: hypothetical protein JXR97_12160 [Planctomycetes bacterium]|nr:hypothetical protein [Planctomycetota bacterium]